ncbi:MAG: ATP-binding cassette domain-containing protein [Spirochaetaceae bacterium]
MIYIDEININYKEKKLLTNTSLKLDNGIFYCFIGRNGSGKTSLFNYFKKNYSNKFNIRMLKQNQNIESSYGISLWDFLKSYCIFERILEWEQLIIKYLTKFDLYDKRFQLIDSLSGGEKQRMFLAQILLGESELILLDESFSNLDIGHKIEYYGLFKEEAKCRDIPIILIEHDLRFALEFSKNILFCHTKGQSLEAYLSDSTELPMIIKQEFGISISSENRYLLLDKNI